jgi:AraC-like DNA-binding protein
MAFAALPALAFGDHQPKNFRSMRDAQDELFRLFPGLVNTDFTSPDGFHFKTASSRINGLALSAVSMPSTRLTFGHRTGPTLVFASDGSANVVAEGRLMTMQAGESVILVPPRSRTEAIGGPRSVVVAGLDDRRLESTLAAMLGPGGEESSNALLKEVNEIAIESRTISFDAVFRSIFTQIDAYANEPALLDVSGVDEIFYRTLLLAINREAFIRQFEMRATSVHARQLDRVCQYVVAELANRITLTDLERIGYMSRRTLHNAFMNAFGMSPMAWVRERRLVKARELLLTSRMSVTEVLYASGFTDASQFSAHYFRRFGEMPSVTRKEKS